MTRVERACATALVIPLVVVTAGAAWVSVGERVGLAPLAGEIPANSAEAAAVGSAGDVFRFLHAGENPHAVHPIRPGIISSSILRATTLEAAMWSRELEMIQWLDEQGVITSGDRAGLACLAEDLGLDDVAEYLARDHAPRCEPEVAIDRVRARTTNRGDVSE